MEDKLMGAMPRKTTILLIMVALFILLCSCASNNDSSISKNEESKAINPSCLFSASGYFIDSENSLWSHDSYTGTVGDKPILTNIEKVFFHYAIDFNGDVWHDRFTTVDSFGQYEYHEEPERINGLTNITSVFLPYSISSNYIGDYTVFLSKNGDIYALGNCYDTQGKSFDPYAQDYYKDLPVIFSSSEPIKLDYPGSAIELVRLAGESELGMIMENNDLVSVQFINNKIETTIMVSNCKEVFNFVDFTVVVTYDGKHFGWGRTTYADESDINNWHEFEIDTPSQIAGLEHVITCSESYVSMDDGSFWERKERLLYSSGKRIPNIENAICINEQYVMTADGKLYYISIYDGEIIEVSNTGHNFDFKKSDVKVDIDLSNDFWKYGGYAQ